MEANKKMEHERLSPMPDVAARMAVLIATFSFSQGDWPMSWITALTASALLTSSYAGGDKERVFRFAKEDLGKVPAHWKATQTNKGTSVWKVVADDTAPSKTGFALAQTAENASSVFNLCVADDTSFQDVEISMAFKALKGKKDQGGGIVWRYQDANNYYVARMNPLEDNFRGFMR